MQAELRRLSEHCEFGTNLNNSLRDKFVPPHRVLLSFCKGSGNRSEHGNHEQRHELQSSRGHVTETASQIHRMDLGVQGPVQQKGAVDAIEKGTKLTTAVLKRRHVTNESAEVTLKQHAKINGKQRNMKNQCIQ